jgi:Tol biopolymer transport system component
LTAEQAVAFTDLVDGQVTLRIGWEKGGPTAAAIGLAAPFFAASVDGRRLVYLANDAGRQPQVVDVHSTQKQTLPFTLPWLSPQDLPALGQREGPIPYQATWHPGGNQIAFYNDTGFYLADLVRMQTCEIDLGSNTGGKRWAVDAQWSSDGRYLAALTTVGDPVVRFVDLTLLDAQTGEYRYLNLEHQFLSAMAWAPNSNHLVVLTEANREDTNRINEYDLFLVDATSDASRRMLADHKFTFSGVYGIVWSPAGQRIALACPAIEPAHRTIAEGRLCIISVEIKQ